MIRKKRQAQRADRAVLAPFFTHSSSVAIHFLQDYFPRALGFLQYSYDSYIMYRHICRWCRAKVAWFALPHALRVSEHLVLPPRSRSPHTKETANLIGRDSFGQTAESAQSLAVCYFHDRRRGEKKIAAIRPGDGFRKFWALIMYVCRYICTTSSLGPVRNLSGFFVSWLFSQKCRAADEKCVVVHHSSCTTCV